MLTPPLRGGLRRRRRYCEIEYVVIELVREPGVGMTVVQIERRASAEAASAAGRSFATSRGSPLPLYWRPFAKQARDRRSPPSDACARASWLPRRQAHRLRGPLVRNVPV